MEGQPVLDWRIKSGPQPICLWHPSLHSSLRSGNSKPIFPDDPNFVNKVEEACNPLSARVEGLLSHFSKSSLIPSMLTRPLPGRGVDANIYEKTCANKKDVSPCKARSSPRPPAAGTSDSTYVHTTKGVLSFPPNSTAPPSSLLPSSSSTSTHLTQSPGQGWKCGAAVTQCAAPKCSSLLAGSTIMRSLRAALTWVGFRAKMLVGGEEMALDSIASS